MSAEQGAYSERAYKIATLDDLIGHTSWGQRGRVALNRRTSPEMLATMAEDENLWVRGCVARNPSTPSNVLAGLAEDEDWGVRMFVAVHPHTSLATLSILADDKHPWVRSCVACNPTVSSDMLARLATDEDDGVRSASTSAIVARLGERANHPISDLAISDTLCPARSKEGV